MVVGWNIRVGTLPYEELGPPIRHNKAMVERGHLERAGPGPCEISYDVQDGKKLPKSAVNYPAYWPRWYNWGLRKLGNAGEPMAMGCTPSFRHGEDNCRSGRTRVQDASGSFGAVPRDDLLPSTTTVAVAHVGH